MKPSAYFLENITPHTEFLLFSLTSGFSLHLRRILRAEIGQNWAFRSFIASWSSFALLAVSTLGRDISQGNYAFCYILSFSCICICLWHSIWHTSVTVFVFVGICLCLCLCLCLTLTLHSIWWLGPAAHSWLHTGQPQESHTQPSFTSWTTCVGCVGLDTTCLLCEIGRRSLHNLWASCL